MNTNAWFILIYATTDADAQDLIARELRGLGRLVVQTAQNSGEYFVVIETASDIPALTVHELVMSVDPDAELVDTHAGPFPLRQVAHDIRRDLADGPAR